MNREETIIEKCRAVASKFDAELQVQKDDFGHTVVWFKCGDKESKKMCVTDFMFSNEAVRMMAACLSEVVEQPGEGT